MELIIKRNFLFEMVFHPHGQQELSGDTFQAVHLSIFQQGIQRLSRWILVVLFTIMEVSSPNIQYMLDLLIKLGKLFLEFINLV